LPKIAFRQFLFNIDAPAWGLRIELTIVVASSKRFFALCVYLNKFLRIWISCGDIMRAATAFGTVCAWLESRSNPHRL